jgi:hypothetical protein
MSPRELRIVARLPGSAAGMARGSRSAAACGALWVAALALGASPASSRPARTAGPWEISIRRAGAPAAAALSAHTAPKLRGRVIELVMVEDRSEELPGAYLFEVRVRNVAHSVQTLRWDLSRSVHVRLADGSTAWPFGHKLGGLSENALAVKGVLAVDVPPHESYLLYPVFSFARLPPGASLVVDGVGVARGPG